MSNKYNMNKNFNIFLLLILMVGLFISFANGCKNDKDNNEEIAPVNPYNGKTTAVFNPNLYYGSLTDIDGNIYKTIIIGTQVWMAENLRTTKYNDGTAILNVSDGSAWKGLSSGAYCNIYNTNNIDTIATFGRLYNWYAINTGKLAPKGWHIPSNLDWVNLQNYLISNGHNYDASNIENLIAKSLASNSGWKVSNNIGVVGNKQISNNRSGFTGLPGGCCDANHAFDGLNEFTRWWSSSNYDEFSAYSGSLAFDNNSFQRVIFNNLYGLSVRCIRD
jgi:uncharacterized protein (TIGR02145 family)